MKEMKKVIDSIIIGADKELYSKTSEELEDYWYYDFETEIEDVSFEYYSFFRALESYRFNCERWEEEHNGHVCVVERVRDKYLMPKIKRFIKKINLEQEGK